jgi:hypothetical protein
MATTVPHDRRNTGAARNLSEPWRRIPSTICALVWIAAALFAGYRYFILLRSPADGIRSELEAAAAEMRTQLVPEPTLAVLAAMRQDFSEQDVTIATTPASSVIVVTLHGVDREACVEAAGKLRRIDGPVVVLLQGYGASEDCGSRNDMTWWIMP